MNSHRKPNLETSTPAIAIRTLLFAILMAQIAHAQTNTGTGPNVNVATNNGASAALSITTGTNNTAYGSNALRADTTGGFNTALGSVALYSNMTGVSNTGVGYGALYLNTASNNTAFGTLALGNNAGGTGNTASGTRALEKNTTGNNSTAVGYYALEKSTTSHDNTAIGYNALLGNVTGSNNIGIGSGAGGAITTGSNNICIGNPGALTPTNSIRIGVQGTQTATFIAGISGITSAGGVAVFVNPSGQLGTITSSQRFKQDIANMDDASDVLHSLRPVRFCYKADIDPKGTPQFGLIAEEVDKVAPELVARDDKGEVYTVRYEAVNAMMLNEFLKEHRRVDGQAKMIEQQARTIAEQQRQIRELASRLSRIAERIETMDPPKTPVLHKISHRSSVSGNAP